MHRGAQSREQSLFREESLTVHCPEAQLGSIEAFLRKLNSTAEIMHTGMVDEVWVVPCGARPDKPSLKTSVMDRMVMCHLAVNTTFGPGFKVKVWCSARHLPRRLACSLVR